MQIMEQMYLDVPFSRSRGIGFGEGWKDHRLQDRTMTADTPLMTIHDRPYLFLKLLE